MRSYCLFIDLLGFSADMLQAELDKTYQQHFLSVYNAFYEATNNIRYNTEFYNNISSELYRAWECKLFSDNILLGSPLNQSIHEESLFGRIIEEIANCQLKLTLNGYFVRGGWSIGNLYIDEVMAYGASLVEAVGLEKKAKFPRIILSNEMLNIVNRHFDFYKMPHEAPQNSDLLISNDGEVFVNYLNRIIYIEEGLFYEKQDIITHKNLILQNLLKFEKANLPFEEREKILAKYKWVADYHNYFFKCINKQYDDPLDSDCFIDFNFGYKFSRLKNPI